MIGIDIVYLPEFEKKLKDSPLEKVFSPFELSQNVTSKSLAGVFAAKEAFFKAVGKKEDWLSVWIEKNRKGKPELKSLFFNDDQKAEVSISHAGDYAIAVVVIENERWQ